MRCGETGGTERFLFGRVAVISTARPRSSDSLVCAHVNRAEEALRSLPPRTPLAAIMGVEGFHNPTNGRPQTLTVFIQPGGATLCE